MCICNNIVLNILISKYSKYLGLCIILSGTNLQDSRTLSIIFPIIHSSGHFRNLIHDIKNQKSTNSHWGFDTCLLQTAIVSTTHLGCDSPGWSRYFNKESSKDFQNQQRNIELCSVCSVYVTDWKVCSCDLCPTVSPYGRGGRRAQQDVHYRTQQEEY